jgi:hypothetical protein
MVAAMNTTTRSDNDAVEKKAALIAGTILALVAIGLVAWGLIEFIGPMAVNLTAEKLPQ